MHFYEPSRFVFLAALPGLTALFWLGRHTREVRLSRLGNARFIQKRLILDDSMEKRRLGAFFLLLVFLLSTLALARPQWGEEKKRIERRGLDVAFLLDTSLSMLAEDIKPDRLRKSKLEIKNLLRRFKGHRVGMVAFAGSSFLQCPLTLDYAAFMLFVDALKPGYIPNPGTSLASAIELGARVFSEETRKYRVLILFTDGEDHEGGVPQALTVAKKAGIRIYSIGVGTPEGAPIPLRSSTTQKVTGYKKDRDGQVIVTRLNSTVLEQVARETGGLYLPATAGEKEMDVLLRHLDTLGERKLKDRLVTEREDHYQFFLLLAFLFLLGESALGHRGRLTGQSVLPLLAFFLFTGFLNSPRSLVDRGNRKVEEKKYRSAVEDYRKAEVARPKDPVVRYNLGTTFYRLFEYRDAEKELDQALAEAKDPLVKAKALYNYGNTKYRLGDFDKAIEAYKKALDLNPKDEDAKYNLEFLQKKKSQFEQKDQERQQQKPKQQQQPQNEKQDQQEPQPQEQKDQKRQQDEQRQDQQQNQQETQSGSQEKKEESGDAGSQDQQEQKQKEEGEQPRGGETIQKEKEQSIGEGERQEQKEERDQKEKRQNQEEEQPQEQPREEAGEEQEQGQGQGPSPQGSQQDSKDGRAPLQGQMSQENALRILDALMESEKELQDLRRPPAEAGSQEPLKDW